MENEVVNGFVFIAVSTQKTSVEAFANVFIFARTLINTTESNARLIKAAWFINKKSFLEQKIQEH
jgi:hypothetical protein